MTRARLLIVAALAAIVLATLLATGSGPSEGDADGSSLSRGARGWLVARRYLEERGVAARLLDDDVEAPGGHAGVLVVTFPWQRFGDGDTLRALDRFLERGGSLLLAYSGESLALGEAQVFSHLDLGWSEPRGEAPLHPLLWRRYASEEWRLTGADPDARPIVIPAPYRVPQAPKDADVWFRGPAQLPAVFAFSRGRGRVVVAPMDALANARLSGTGNADLLERLRGELGRSWAFDEFHHGLVAPARATPGSRRVLDLYLFHLLFLYGVTAWALVRRFGTAWREPATVASSVRGFLVGMGSLHDRLGHHADAAARLVDRAREFDPRLRLPNEAPPRDKDGFLALARRLGRAQTRREKAE